MKGLSIELPGAALMKAKTGEQYSHTADEGTLTIESGDEMAIRHNFDEGGDKLSIKLPAEVWEDMYYQGQHSYDMSKPAEIFGEKVMVVLIKRAFVDEPQISVGSVSEAEQ